MRPTLFTVPVCRLCTICRCTVLSILRHSLPTYSPRHTRLCLRTMVCFRRSLSTHSPHQCLHYWTSQSHLLLIWRLVMHRYTCARAMMKRVLLSIIHRCLSTSIRLPPTSFLTPLSSINFLTVSTPSHTPWEAYMFDSST